jgi:hypothetical protein
VHSGTPDTAGNKVFNAEVEKILAENTDAGTASSLAALL